MLTPREIEVLRLLSCGCSYAMVGLQLGVSANTVTSHVKNAYRKLEVHTAAAAVMRAVELRLLGQS
ncbi:MAG: LuxR C-terminal-related transcriptional regulator [Betaproteobacteria bacterium]|nr:LuxR C-terminal-related transcriptional regulator [Betaproteobacteria bacterium]